MSVRPPKTQISLGIRPVWSESSLSAWRKLGLLATHRTHSKDSDQTGWMPRLIWVFAGRTATLLVLSLSGSFMHYWGEWKNHYKVLQNHNGILIIFTACHTTAFRVHALQWYCYMSPVKRICVFEHSVMTNFNCACPAIQRGQGSGFLSEGSSCLTACMSEQRRFWRDCADAQARLNLRCSHRR